MDKITTNYWYAFFKLLSITIVLMTIIISIAWILTPTDWSFKFMMDDNLKEVILNIYSLNESQIYNNTYVYK